MESKNAGLGFDKRDIEAIWFYKGFVYFILFYGAWLGLPAIQWSLGGPPGRDKPHSGR
ncbi:MAG: hypothetical protein Kow0037_00900 [Calditrichia bacterium]